MFMSLEIEMYFELTNESVRKECTAGLKIINQVLQIGFCKRISSAEKFPLISCKKLCRR